MADSKSVVIRLTNEQREAIKRATGKDITELKVDALEGRVTPAAGFADEFRKAPAELRKSPLADSELRKAPMADNELRKAPLADTELRKAPMTELRKAPTGGIVDTE
jgi:hypothetical protein